MRKYRRVLSIAGFDGSGGAGLQADLKTCSALGCYAMTAMTAHPIQNTLGVQNIVRLEPKTVSDQIAACLEDIGADCIKIGMLDRGEIIEAVVDALSNYKGIPIVLDPVMVAKGGDFLLDPNAIETLRRDMLPNATVVTPNIPEAEALTKIKIETQRQMAQAAKIIGDMGPENVVIKGGHFGGSKSSDCLYETKSQKLTWFIHDRINTKNTHGTGCTFSAAIAAFLAHGHSVHEATKKAKIYISRALLHGASYQIGKGCGPVHYFFEMWD